MMHRREKPRSSSAALRRAHLLRRARLALVAIAALPVFQTTGCFPDPVGALNFQLQNLVNATLIDWVSVIVQNFLRI